MENWINFINCSYCTTKDETIWLNFLFEYIQLFRLSDRKSFHVRFKNFRSCQMKSMLNQYRLCVHSIDGKNALWTSWKSAFFLKRKKINISFYTALADISKTRPAPCLNWPKAFLLALLMTENYSKLDGPSFRWLKISQYLIVRLTRGMPSSLSWILSMRFGGYFLILSHD